MVCTARLVVRGSILRKTLIVAACVLVSACIQTPVALAQRGAGRVGGGGGHFNSGGRIGIPHGVAPPPSPARILRPPVFAGPRVGSPAFAFRQHPIFRHPVFRHPELFGAPFLGAGLGFNSFWCPNCGPFWTWGFSSPLYWYGFENYVTPQPYESPLYVYNGEERELVQLYLKDGTVYNVTDYWLVNGQIHFTMIDETGTKSVEQVIGFDELDLQRTIDVNTQLGFKFVLRNEPWQKYLQDHPDLTPPAGPPSQKNQ
jgi:hypothetical protein